MQTHSTFRCTPKAFGLAILLSCGLVFVGWAQAGQYRLLAEKSNAVVVAARVQNAEQVCNLEISIQGQATLEREVRAPDFEARIDINPHSPSRSWFPSTPDAANRIYLSTLTASEAGGDVSPCG